MTRDEHMEWCKKRAFISMASDLGKHTGTANHAAINLGMMMIIGGHLSTTKKMRDFIEGFN